MADKREIVRKFLDNIPDRFDVLEEGIDVQTHKEYLDYSHSFDTGELTDEKTLQLSSFLFSSENAPTAKKKVLTLLAHLGTITAYRQIEKYCKNPDKELKQWAALALQECKMFLESTLTDQETGFISSGLGGLKDKLRFFFMVLPSTENPFTGTQKGIIKSEFNLVSAELNCIVETVNLSEKFVGLTVLVPMDVAVGTLIETGINKCNELGDFVFKHYYVTNQNIPDKTEIDYIINKVKG